LLYKNSRLRVRDRVRVREPNLLEIREMLFSFILSSLALNLLFPKYLLVPGDPKNIISPGRVYP
jgi:hypothetical protein